MARATYVFRDGKLVPKHLAPPLDRHARGPGSSLGRPMVISDNLGGIQGLRHPSTGEFMDSKSRFRAETRARGLTEMGNEAFPVRRAQSEAELAREIAADAAEVYDMLEAGGEAIAAKPLDSEVLKPELATNV